jgi:PAS domain S-box-containing protein
VIPRTINARVIITFVLLIALAVLEAELVRYVQREANTALDQGERIQTVLHQQDEAGRALAAMQAAQRGYLITGDRSQVTLYESESRNYQQATAILPAILVDRQQQQRFAHIQQLVAEWQQNVARRMIEERARGRDVSGAVIAEAIPMFQRIQEELEAFEQRETQLRVGAALTARARVRRATLILTLNSAASVALVIALMIAARRGILVPLAELARSARRLAAGDSSATLPRIRRDEIGDLITAFADMRHAVEARQGEIRAAHQELLAIINTVPAALLIIDRDGSVRLQNKAAAQLLGKTPVTEAERKAYWQSFSVRDSSGAPIRMRDVAPVRALAGNEILGEELEVQSPNGRTATILVSAAPLRDEQGRVTGAAAGFQDITRLRELDRIKNEFVSVVSHELRTPLTAIRGSLQLLLIDQQSVPDPGDRELMEVALRSCERLVRIVNDILDVSKMEAGKFRLRPKATPVADVIAHSTSVVQRLASDSGVHFTIDVPAGVPPLLADPDRLTQALVNLLSNAIKFAPSGSEVRIAAREDGGFVEIAVSDRGAGIAPDDIARLFQKFQQLDSSETRRVGGTGLGLTITKGIIEEHGGSISVQSTPGAGTTFIIRVPMSALPAAPAPEEAAPASARQTGPGTVLIVEDEEETRLVLRRALEAAGFQTLEAATGREAVDLARRHQPDGITLDIVLPDGDGFWVLKELQADPATASVPIVIVSGTEPDSTVAAAFVAKPFDPAALVADVQRALHGLTHATVMVADDDADVRHVLGEALQRQGCRVVQAEDGRDALEKLAHETFDLVVVDLDMPHVHGHDIIRALRDPAAPRRVPIIVLSGSGTEQQTMQSLVLGANVFMSKPPDARALAREVARLLSRR